MMDRVDASVESKADTRSGHKCSGQFLWCRHTYNWNLSPTLLLGLCWYLIIKYETCLKKRFGKNAGRCAEWLFIPDYLLDTNVCFDRTSHAHVIGWVSFIVTYRIYWFCIQHYTYHNIPHDSVWWSIIILYHISFFIAYFI